MRTFFLSCALVLTLAGVAVAKPLTADLVKEPQLLLPYCFWLQDLDGKQTIDSISSGTLQERFAPLQDGIPVKSGGPIWIRLVLYKTALNLPGGLSNPGASDLSPAGRNRLILNPGKLPPGKTSIFFPSSPGSADTPDLWRSEDLRSNEAILLPDPGLTPINIYIRMDEMPGLWFAPVISPEHAGRPAMLPSELLLPGIIIAAAFSCLLRALADRAQWAMWATLFLACVLAQAVLPLPASGKDFTPQDLPALLAPGMALLLLPHIGRCIFRTNESSFMQDGTLYICSLFGAGVALAPLVPGLQWLTRLFPLWPLLLIPLLPLCLGALAAKRPGALSFAGACVMPILGACVTLFALRSPMLHPLAPLGSLWGLAVGGLGLALARIPSPYRAQGQPSVDVPVQVGLLLAESAADTAKTQAADSGLTLTDTPAFTQKSQYDELPPLEITPLADSKEDTPVPDSTILNIDLADFSPSVPETVRELPDLAFAPDPAVDTGLSAPSLDSLEVSELKGQEDSAVAPPSFEIGQDSSGLPSDSDAGVAMTQKLQGMDAAMAVSPDPDAAFPDVRLPGIQAVTPTATSVQQKGTDTTEALSTASSHPDKARPWQRSGVDFPFPLDFMEELTDEPARHSSFPTAGGFVFSLHSLVREVHDIVTPLAKARGLLFSWYIAPSLPNLLEGDAPSLRGALSLLLQNSVQATRQGAVHLAVRKQPGGNEDGELLFSISDGGAAQRVDAGFFHAWELAARTGGVFNLEFSPSGGTQISFTVRFTLPSEESVQEHMTRFPAGRSIAPVDGDAEPAFEDEEPVPVLYAMTDRLNGQAPISLEDTPDVLEASEQPFPFPTEEVRSTAMPRNSSEIRSFSKSQGEAAVGPLTTEAPPEPPSTTSPPTMTGKSGELVRILTADMTTSNRRLLAHYLADLPHEHLNVDNAGILAAVYNNPVSLIIFDADMPEPDIMRTMAALRREEAERGDARTPVLVLTSHESQSARMLSAGATHALIKPFPKNALREIVLQAIPKFVPPGRHVRAAFIAEEQPVEAGSDNHEGLSSADSEAVAIPLLSMSEQNPVPDGPDGQDDDPQRAVDLLKAAWRDAPVVRSSNIVTLPPRHGIDSSPPTLTAWRADPGQTPPVEPFLGDASAAAPMLLSLSSEDVTPSPAGSESRREASLEGSLLDFILPDGAREATAVDDPLLAESARARPDSGEDTAVANRLADAVSPAVEEAAAREEEVPPSVALTGTEALSEHLSESVVESQAADRFEALEESGGVAQPFELTPSIEPEPTEADGVIPIDSEEASPASQIVAVFPLPGIEGESLDSTVFPLVPGIVFAMQTALRDMLQGSESRQSILVQEAAGRLARKAEDYGLHKLGKIARCVERAAEADDLEAVSTLLEDLAPVTKRYQESLQECFQSFINLDR